jgi:hypothetical protein
MNNILALEYSEPIYHERREKRKNGPVRTRSLKLSGDLGFEPFTYSLSGQQH